MKKSNVKRNVILSALFFLPVAFLIIMMLTKDNYNPLDIVNKNVRELPVNQDSIQMEGHITLLAFFGKNPLENSISALNLKELVYDRNKGFKKFQIVVLLPKEAEADAEKLFKKISSYEDLRFWHFVYAKDYEIRNIFNSLKSEVKLNDDLATTSVFIVDKDKFQRGRIDDRTEKEKEAKKLAYSLYSYDCIDINQLKNKLATEDMRVLFKEYRDKRTGKFEGSTTRRADDLKN